MHNQKESKKDRWCIDFYDQSGKRRLKVLPKGTTKATAKKALREIEDQVEKRAWMPTKNIPKFSEVADNWLEYKRQNVRTSTWEMYRGHLQHHFHDIKPVMVSRISTAKVEKFITGKQKNGINLTTLKKIIVTFNQVMNYAVRHKYIDHNPVRDAERPKGQGKISKPHITVLQPDEINSFLNAESDPEYRTLFMLAIMSGARQGELLGLKWTDVDWFNDQIKIERTYNKKTWYSPKSKASYRRIDLGPSMMTELKAWNKICPKTELDLVFPNKIGRPIDQSKMLSRRFYPALREAGIRRMRFHDLRHTYASLIIEQGENIKYIQTQLGHSSPTITLDVYAHLMKPVNQEAARRLDKRVFGKNGDQMETKNKKGITKLSVTP